MCIYTHVTAGALVGSLAPNSGLALVFGIVSHGVLDLFPHFDFPKIRVEILLGVLALVLVIWAGGPTAPVLLGAIGGVLPDLENLAWKLGWLPEERKIFPTHTGLIPHGRELGPGNLWVQTALSLVCIVALGLRYVP